MQKLTAIKAKALLQDLSGLRTIREELFRQALEIALPILEQQERGDDWIEWGGGECPVKGATLVDIKFRNGDIIRGYKPRHLDWRLDGDIGDIIAYRVVS